MRIAMLGPIFERPRPGPEGSVDQGVQLLCQELIHRGVDVDFFPVTTSRSQARLAAINPRSSTVDPDLYFTAADHLCLSELFERAADFDLIHNHAGSYPLTYSGLVETPMLTTICGASSRDLPIFQKYNGRTYYVSLSLADRIPKLDYLANVYPGISMDRCELNLGIRDTLLCWGPVHPGQGVSEAIEVARRSGMKLVIAGDIQDQSYFDEQIAPCLNDKLIEYLGPVMPEKRSELLSAAYASLHLVSSDFSFAYSLIESLACGTPVIAWNRAANGEIIDQEKTGFLVASLNEAVEAVKQVRNIDRAGCRRVVEERFSLDRMVTDYLGVYDQILSRQRNLRADTMHDRRPWGEYWVLEDTDRYKVKRIDVLPGKRLSYQKHLKRSEHWFIVKGTAKVTLDGRDIVVKAAQPVDIPAETAHRIENIGDDVLTFIEVQHGKYFGEDDIIRLQDDFGRIPS